MLHSLLPLEDIAILGLVLMREEGHGFTRAAELSWSLKIGIYTIVNQVMVHMTVAIFVLIALIKLVDNGLIGIAKTDGILFVSLSNWC